MGLMRLTHIRPEVTPEVTVAETVRVMAEAEIGAIAVMDGKKLAGVFTERDLMKRVVAGRLDPETTPVKEVMTRNVVSVLDSTTVARAAAVMRAHRMRSMRLPPPRYAPGEPVEPRHARTHETGPAPRS